MNNLRTLRKSKNMTLKVLAEVLGISESAISLYETGKRQPEQSVLMKIADYFDVTVDYLLGRTSKSDEVVLEGVYFRLAREAQELGLPPEDIEKIIELYRKYKK